MKNHFLTKGIIFIVTPVVFKIPKMKKGTKLKMKSNRFAKIHMKKEFVLIEENDVLTFQGEFDGRLIFSTDDDKRISIDKTLFNKNNYDCIL